MSEMPKRRSTVPVVASYCLPTCASEDKPPLYAPVTAGEHLKAKLMGPRLLQPSDATDTAGDRGR